MSLSGADWTRIQRLKQARNYNKVLASNKDIINVVSPASNPFNVETLESRVVGSSRTRREVSKWTDYIASRAQDYMLYSGQPRVGPTTVIVKTLVRVNCNCGTITGANSRVVTTKYAGCAKCSRI